MPHLLPVSISAKNFKVVTNFLSAIVYKNLSLINLYILEIRDISNLKASSNLITVKMKL